MRHVVTREPYICPKCDQQNMGSAEAVLDLLICPDCGQKYRDELMPIFEKMAREYFTEIKNPKKND